MKFLKKNKIYAFFIIFFIIIGIICLLAFVFSRDKVISYTNDESVEFLKDYSINQFVPVYLTDEQIVSIYYNDYINKMLYDREEAYNLLYDRFKKKNFPTYNDYNNDVQEMMDSSDEFTIKEFQIDEKDYETVYTITDNNSRVYIFHVIAVMQYSVEFYIDK